jgi:hypothetical protein
MSKSPNRSHPSRFATNILYAYLCGFHVTPNVRISPIIDFKICAQGDRYFVPQNLLGCTAMFLIECRPTFQRHVLPPSSGHPEDSELHTHHHENLKSHISVIFIASSYLAGYSYNIKTMVK